MTSVKLELAVAVAEACTTFGNGVGARPVRKNWETEGVKSVESRQDNPCLEGVHRRLSTAEALSALRGPSQH